MLTILGLVPWIVRTLLLSKKHQRSTHGQTRDPDPRKTRLYIFRRIRFHTNDGFYIGPNRRRETSHAIPT